MARAQSQYLRIYDTVGVTHQRWQSYYANTSVSWDSASWQYVPFEADGFTAGISGDEVNVSVTAPAIPLVLDAFDAAIRDGRLVEIRIYQFDAAVDNNTPQAGQELLALYSGQVIGGSADLTTVTMTLGIPIAPVGAQVPPRKFTTAMMGKGCKL